MITINIPLEDAEHAKLMKIKNGYTWREFIIEYGNHIVKLNKEKKKKKQ